MFLGFDEGELQFVVVKTERFKLELPWKLLSERFIVLTKPNLKTLSANIIPVIEFLPSTELELFR